MRLLAIAWVLMVGVAAVSSCYETPRNECAFTCGPEDACPATYSCRPDGWCKREGVADDFQCAPPRPDAAPVIDAGLDAGPPPDAGLDAGATATLGRTRN